MTMLKVQIVEDDPSYALELEMILRDLGCEVFPTINNPVELRVESGNQPDILIADIMFENKPLGIELIPKMKDKGIPVILLTSQTDEKVYYESRGLLPAGYAIKPIQPLSLKSLIENALVLERNPDALNRVLKDWNRKQLMHRYLFVRHGGLLVKVVVNAISRVEADGNYCYSYEDERRYIVKSSLRHLKGLLSSQGFLQVNRGQLVNFSLVEQVDFANNVLYCGGQKIAIGNIYRKEIESWLNRI